MALRPLNCTRCGAALRDEPKDGLVRCSYCGQNHAYDVPEPARDAEPLQPMPPVKSSRLAFVALGALLVIAAATILVSFTGSSREPAGLAGADGPGDPSVSYSANQQVDVYWGSSWWPGTIKAVLGAGRYRIGYDGWSSSWDEDVTPRRLRRRAAAVAAPVQDRPVTANEVPGDPKALYKAGEVVDIHWGQRWWPGRIVAVTASGYHISYDGWASSYDETVDATRLRRR